MLTSGIASIKQKRRRVSITMSRLWWILCLQKAMMNNESCLWKNAFWLQDWYRPEDLVRSEGDCISEELYFLRLLGRAVHASAFSNFTHFSFPQTHLISWPDRSVHILQQLGGSPAAKTLESLSDARSGWTVMLCGPALLAGCYLLQLLFKETSGKYVTYCSAATFDIWMDLCRQIVC